jgi:hypothetical protein
MNRSKVPLLSAVAVLVLFVAGTAALGTPLQVDDSPAKTVAWLQLHRADVPVAVTCFTLSAIPFLVLAAWVRRALPDVYGYAFLAGAAAFIGQFVVSSWFLSGAALHADTIEPQTARSLLDVGAYFGPVLSATDVVMAGAVALAALREGVFSRWLGWLSAVFAVEQLAEMSTIYGTSGFAAPGGAWNSELGAGLFMIWMIGTAVAVGRRPVQASA